MRKSIFLISAIILASGCQKQPPKPDPIELKKAEFIAVCNKRLAARTMMPSLYKMVSHEDRFMVGKGDKDYTFDSSIEYDLPNNQGLPIRFKAECHYNYPTLSDAATPDHIFIDNRKGEEEMYELGLRRLQCKQFDWDFQVQSYCIR